ncbi:type IV pilus biogenesis protein PilI [Neisseria animaloris]|uniref:type IV pilus modification protein PilV n=1 Tax=Neisseria animaloris TaxID=326522 RepID=UPI000F6EA593|nr:type IV pilus modification protein PilV [Neisseria animaloris]MDO5073131.1 type IV pilus modification protein PilV [Neisseria animaloris]VEH86898.1 type IV pilus biogenesis protein PilI [Neisseria animaloris]
MKKSFQKYLNSRNPHFKREQSGMTLLEVLISMFVLAIGVLALLATQLRTVSSVREAEGQTVVAQAVQNLIEGMMINPTLSKEINTTPEGERKDTGRVRKRYDDNSRNLGRNKELSYRVSNPRKARTCEASRWCKSGDSLTSLDKRALLEDQLGRFEDALVKALPDATIYYSVCNDSSGRDMTITNGRVVHNCQGSDGDPLVIKVVWQMDIESGGKDTENRKSPLNQNGTSIVYSYQARVGE